MDKMATFKLYFSFSKSTNWANIRLNLNSKLFFNINMSIIIGDNIFPIFSHIYLFIFDTRANNTNHTEYPENSSENWTQDDENNCIRRWLNFFMILVIFSIMLRGS